MQVADCPEHIRSDAPRPADPPGVVATARRAARALASAALMARDGRTADHSEDVEELCGALADELEIVGDEREQLLAAAALHDIGKLAMPNSILDKAGPLDAAEWDQMRQHTVLGERILLAVPEMTDVALVVRNAHERWDGQGYPDGRSGDAIPLASRVIFCADAFHAIRSDRPYRAGRSAAEAISEIEAGSGSQFDPRVAAALVRIVRHLPVRGRRHRRLSPRALMLLMTLGLVATAGAAVPGLRHAVESVFGGRHDDPPAVRRPATSRPARVTLTAPALGTLPAPVVVPAQGARVLARHAVRPHRAHGAVRAPKSHGGRAPGAPVTARPATPKASRSPRAPGTLPPAATAHRHVTGRQHHDQSAHGVSAPRASHRGASSGQRRVRGPRHPPRRH